MTTAGEINVKLGLNSDSFIKSMDDAEREIQALEGKLKMSQKQFDHMAKAMAATKNPTKEMTDAFKRLKAQLQQDQSAFNDFQKKVKDLDGGLAQNVGGVNNLSGALGKLASEATKVFAVGKIISFLKESNDAYRTQVIAIDSLNTALLNAGVYTDDYAVHLQKLSSEIQKYSNYGDEVIEKAIAQGQAYAGNIKLTDELIKATVDYAAATDTDLNTAFTLVGKSIGTSTNALARYGVSLDDSMSKEEKAAAITSALSSRFEGQAANAAMAGEQLKNAFGDLTETIGGTFNPAVEASLKVLSSLVDWSNRAVLAVNKLHGRYIDFIGSLKGMRTDEDKEWFRNQVGFKDLSKEILASSDKIANAQNKIANSQKIIGTSNQTKQQDKALEAYKKYIDEYQKLTQNYEATLQARQYLEGTLNIDPIKQQQEYDQALKVYQAYFAKIQEINISGARNKSELLKLNEENLARELQEIRVNKELETQRKLNEIVKGYQDERKSYQINELAEQDLGGFFGKFTTGYKERLELLKWYYTEHEKISSEHYATLEEQQRVFNELDQNYALRNAQIQKDIWTQRGEEITSIFSQTFDTMLTNYGDFSENMQQLVLNLSRYIIKEAFQSMFTQLTQMQGLQGGLSNIFSQMFGQANKLAQSYATIAQGALTANLSTQAMTTTQAALAPLSASVSASMAASASQYAIAAAGAQQLAAAIAQLAVAEAAYSVAKIPFVGGFLAPVAATATGAAIAAATALVAGASLLGSTLNKAGSTISSLGGAGRSVATPAPLNADLPIYHSGGIVPGTKEQLAVLQGGERVLNRSESASYANGEGGAESGVNNIMMFNIKAWDGKDVINTLKANSQTINQIVNSGIKNNQQGLRSTVQNI